MPSLNISLPAPMREWVEAQVRGGRYGNASEYLRELIRRDQERQAQERLERLLLDGVESGKAAPLTKKDWAEEIRELLEVDYPEAAKIVLDMLALLIELFHHRNRDRGVGRGRPL